MFDPASSQKGDNKNKKAGSFVVQTNDEKTISKENNPKSTGGEILEKPLEFDSERRHSFDFPKSITDYDLDYLEELELNRAFNVLEDL